MTMQRAVIVTTSPTTAYPLPPCSSSFVWRRDSHKWIMMRPMMPSAVLWVKPHLVTSYTWIFESTWVGKGNKHPHKMLFSIWTVWIASAFLWITLSCVYIYISYLNSHPGIMTTLTWEKKPCCGLTVQTAPPSVKTSLITHSSSCKLHV